MMLIAYDEKKENHMSDLQWDRTFALEQAGDDEDMLAELLVLFKETTVNDFNKIQEAYQGQNPQAIAAAAHSIKGASASLGVESVRIVASELEQAGNAGNIGAVSELMEHLGSLLKQMDGLK